ncbi:Uncharacterised protein [Escherichia coli]|nr:Uncharacterised protein [Escherichia coli]
MIGAAVGEKYLVVKIQKQGSDYLFAVIIRGCLIKYLTTERIE